MSKSQVKVDGVAVIAEVLQHAGKRPQVNDGVGEKNKYAVRFAEHVGRRIAADLSPRMKGITASSKREAGAVGKKKQLDINFSTAEHGLALGISLKSVHLGDVKNGRYTHNMKRNEEELRIEASGYHKRQPYAVMVGVLFLPFDSCDDAKKNNSSSFGSWVRHLRPFCERNTPEDEVDRFEKLYVAVYEVDGSDLMFFDVASDPPKKGRPTKDGPRTGSDGRTRRLLSYAEFLDDVHHIYLRRNKAEFRWADGEEDSLSLDEIDEATGEEDTTYEEQA